jgi:hypothetical protein
MHPPRAIEGYPSSLYNLALLLKDKGLYCNIPVCFTSSENLLDFQRQLIEERFHTKIFDHYGTTERTIRISESIKHDGYFEDPGYSINCLWKSNKFSEDVKHTGILQYNPLSFSNKAKLYKELGYPSIARGGCILIEAALGNPFRTSSSTAFPTQSSWLENRLFWATLIHKPTYVRWLSHLVKIQRAQVVKFKRAPT